VGVAGSARAARAAFAGSGREVVVERAAYRRWVLRNALWTLRQRRYATLAVGMFIVAVICVIAGTWQISRFRQTVHDNDLLNANAQAAAVPLTTALVPLVGHGPAPSRDAIRYRTITATGTYELGAQLIVNQSVNGNDGFYVLNPLRTTDGVVLVVRGFVPENSDGSPPATIPAPPSTAVSITGELQTPGTANDGTGELGPGQIESVNPTEQATRLGGSVFNAYVTLNPGQPGTSALMALPAPDLSNPAGGAYEWQHFAYIIQWYLFALLALAAPFVIGRHEVREAQRTYLGIDPARRRLDLELEADQRELLAPQLTAGSTPGGEVVVRPNGALVVPAGEPTAEQWEWAARLADRYGRSLGAGHEAPADRSARARPIGKRPVGPVRRPLTTNSATGVHPSDDSYHGAYNDYLWELAMADGSTPDVPLRPPTDQADPAPDGAVRIIEGAAADVSGEPPEEQA
jgi:cytochrome oxidase assembly protein ShyY1